MDKKVLSKEELQKLKDFQTKEDSLVILFGQIAYQQHSLEEEQDRAIEEKEIQPKRCHKRREKNG